MNGNALLFRWIILLGLIALLGSVSLVGSCAMLGQHEKMIESQHRYEGAVRINSVVMTITDPAELHRLRPMLLQSLDESTRLMLMRQAGWDANGRPQVPPPTKLIPGVYDALPGGPKQQQRRRDAP